MKFLRMVKLLFSSKIIQCKTRSGHMISVDTSRAACKPFGFYSGQRIVNGNGYKAVVIGVAPDIDGEELYLWYRNDGEEGICHWSADKEKNLRDEGFRLLSEKPTN